MFALNTVTHPARFVIACSFILLAPQGSALAGFTDVTSSAGVLYRQWNPLPNDGEIKRMSGGAAAGDLDGDGWPDLFVTRMDGTDILFRNLGNGTFSDASRAAGFDTNGPTNGAALGDVDNDGDLDLYVTSLGDNHHNLYINDGSGKFSEQGRNRNAAIMSSDNLQGMSAAFGDYDADGYLDLHVTEWGKRVDPGVSPKTLVSHARLLRNNGVSSPGHFVDATESAGVVIDYVSGASAVDSINGAYAFTSTFADFDRDGHADLAIAGDFHTSQLYWNNGDGTFQKAPGPFEPNPSGIGTDENGMGSAIADFNGDGMLDWFVSAIFDPDEPCFGRRCSWNSSGNRLYLNNGDRTFADVTETAGVRDGHWGWGSTFFDYDNDGDLDLALTNGMVSPNIHSSPFHDDPMKLWRNNGDGTFVEVAAAEGVDDKGSGKGLLTLDYDLDGDLDLFVVNNAGEPTLFRNDNDQRNSYLKVTTEGTQSNRDGIGAFVTLFVDEDSTPQTRYITGGGTNFLSQSDMTVHFGLGRHDGPIDRLIIDWPSGVRQEFSNLNVNMTLHAIEPVPEPASGTMLLISMLGFAGRARPRSRSDDVALNG